MAVIVFSLVQGPQIKVADWIDGVAGSILLINLVINPILYFEFQSEFKSVLQTWISTTKGSILPSVTGNRTLRSTDIPDSTEKLKTATGSTNHWFSGKPLDEEVSTRN